MASTGTPGPTGHSATTPPTQGGAPTAQPVTGPTPTGSPAPGPQHYTFQAQPPQARYTGRGWYWLPGAPQPEDLPAEWNAQPNHFLTFWQNLNSKQIGVIVGVFFGLCILLCCGLGMINTMLDS